MLLWLNAINDRQEIRQFFCQFPELEAGLELLNQIVAKGDILLNAGLIEDNQHVSLPVEAFDGVSFLPILKQLEQEWNTILAKSHRSDRPSDLVDSHWYREKLNYYEQNITRLELMISDINRRCQRAEGIPGIKDETVFTRYQSIVKRYESQLNQAHLIRSLLLNHL